MLRICFVKVGNAYGPEYVNILADCISRNLEAGTPGTFECFTDDPAGISPHITAHPVPEGLGGWWAKMWLFKNGHFDYGDRILYFDLDTVIMGPLDAIVKYDGHFAALRDFFKPYDDVQSAVLAWPANTLPVIWGHWDRAGRPQPVGGDQEVIQEVLDANGIKPDFWQDLYPNLFVSYKSGSYKRVPPKGCSVLCFHGEPKPHNCNSTWVNGVWQINGTQAFEIEQICNTAEDKIAENIRHAMSLDYPWLEPQPENDAIAIIVGGAPSLKTTYAEISQVPGGVVFATNNTARFLQERSIQPDYHVIVDARYENAKFVTEKPPERGYLIGSQCDLQVFTRCAVQGCTATAKSPITIFHPKINGIVELVENDPRPKCIVGGGSTVCLKAIAIAYILGYRKFHLFGMDSSLSDAEHHAYEQKQNDDDLVVRVQVDDQFFMTTPWMVAQADEFEDLLVELSRLGCEFAISGDGLIPYIVQEMTSSYAVRERVDALLSRLPSDQALMGAEIGVFGGDMSAHLLRNPNVTLLMVDAWDSSVYAPGEDDFHAGLSQEQQNACKARAIEQTEFAKGRRNVMHFQSENAANVVRDGSLDFVFIDADHSYEGCNRDLNAWYPKVKLGGLFSGHDYDHPDFPSWGVKKAVDEFAASHGLQVTLGENFTWFINKPSALEIAA